MRRDDPGHEASDEASGQAGSARGTARRAGDGDDRADLPVESPHDRRRRRILDAAASCFAGRGFHASTMQDIAAAAGMSPGNLYRYFESKDAVVVGLAARDRDDMATDLQTMETIADPVDGFRVSMRKHLVDESRECAALSLEIWAEATRNSTFATICEDFERVIVAGIGDLVRRKQALGMIASSVDPVGFARLAYTLADGLFVRRAISANFDAERVIEYAAAVIDAVARGLVPLPAGPDSVSASLSRSQE